MIEFLLAIPLWAGIVVSMALATAIGLLVYWISYKLISRHKTGDLAGPTEALFAVVGMLVSLMLSLAFAEVVGEVRTIGKTVEREAVALADLHVGLEQFDREMTRGIRRDLIDYSRSIVEDDWPALANDRLGQRTSALRNRLSQQISSLQPINEAQRQRWSRLLDDLDSLSDFRLIRFDNALAGPPVYVYTVMFGFLITMACFGVYRPQLPVICLASLFTVFVGLVLFLIVALSDPFRSGIGVSPSTFERLVETLESQGRH